MNGSTRHDVIVVGGGLSGCLAAWWLKRRIPKLDVLLIERDSHLGGNHTWSFFDSDLTVEENQRIACFVEHQWPAYRVRFPRHVRTLPTTYRSVTSIRLHDIVAAELGGNIRYGAEVKAVGTRDVTFASGEVSNAECVIDARGEQVAPHLAVGFQKFFGCELRLSAPHGETIPMIMDASVPQKDGYRFVYTLPFAPDRVLVEDTYYTQDANLPPDQLRARIFEYVSSKGWDVAETVREEHGLLPIILAGDIEEHLALGADAAPRIGLAGTFFHPTTGYSLPDAVRVAGLIADLAVARGTLHTDALRTMLLDCTRRLWRERSYFRLLNRMMFQAGKPDRRYTILERFYRLDADLVQRFYAASLTPMDKLRIVAGRPPVPILNALACVSQKKTMAGIRGT
jgi:lycopene beta-cyclase